MNSEAKRKYICANASKLTNIDLVDIGKILVYAGHKSKITESADGCRILLDKIDDDTVNNIYTSMQHKLKK